jgi:RNA polymerase sigma factor (sigma-70 family)
MSREALYLEHLDLIEQAIRFTCRRNRCSPDEADELAGAVRLALVEDDYAILAAFEGRSKLSTYLTVVVQRLLLEERVRRWGRFRPSAEAKRLGPLAVRIESLVVRDGHALEDAYQILRAVSPDLARDTVVELAARLPPRTGRRFEGEDALADVASPEPAPEAALLEREAAARKRQADGALHAAMAVLPPQDQLILRLRFCEGRQVVEIAAALAIEARPLYRRIEALATQLKRALAAQGFGATDFGWGTALDEPRARTGPQRAGWKAADAQPSSPLGGADLDRRGRDPGRPSDRREAEQSEDTARGIGP